MWELSQGLGSLIFGCGTGVGRLEQLDFGTLGTSVSPKRFARNKAVEHLERLERTGPRGERSEAVERLERLELATA
jgi:hypothetical protein